MIDRPAIKARMQALGATIAELARRTGRRWQDVAASVNGKPTRVERQFGDIVRALDAIEREQKDMKP